MLASASRGSIVSINLPRSLRRTPKPSNSASRYPRATPSTSLPSPNRLTTAASAATFSTECIGSSNTAVPTRSVFVRPRIEPAAARSAGQ